MVSNNIYKPRYKIAFQAKSKVWPYKNSRLRRFFNIRGRKLVRRGLFKRYFLVFNNMKWTIARRYIRPYMKKRRPLRHKYRNIFYTKQQLRAFYGIQKEEIFRNFFKKFLGGAKGRNKMFAIALERRVDMVLFRLRFLPTIYACNQFVHHFGVNINGKKELSANALIVPGDIITFEKAQWSSFVEYLYERLYWRTYGLNVWKSRQFKSLRKKVWWCSKNKFFRKSNVFALKKINFTVRRLLKVNTMFSQYLPLFYKEVKAVENFNLDDTNGLFMHLRQNVLFLWQNYRKTMRNLIHKIMAVSTRKWRLSLWNWRHYYAQYFTLITLLFRFYKTLMFYFTQFKTLELFFYKNIINLNTKNDWKSDSFFYTELKLSLENLLLVQNTQLKDLNKQKDVYNKVENVLGKKIMFFKNKINHLLWLSVINKKISSNSFLSIRAVINRKLMQLVKKQMLIRQDLQAVQLKKNILATEISKTIYQKNIQYDVLTKEISTKMQLKTEMHNLITQKLNLIETRFTMFQQKINFLMNFIIKRRIKRYSLKSRNGLQDKRGASQILYFLTRRRLKKEKRLAYPRLKKVHWFVPNYIYFDYRTLRAVYLYNPRPEEIIYSFKCSLRSIYSFYRSRGL